MRNLVLMTALIALSITYSACNKKDNKSENFILLTDHLWESDSLLVGGVDASGPGELLEKFAGEAEFREDGTGTFGRYNGDWYFTNSETNITITSDSLLLPLTCMIRELTESSFKITTSFTDLQQNVLDIRITFKAK